MRRVPALLATSIALLGPLSLRAQAECFCLCVGGQATNVCTQPFDREPICRRVCPLPIAQQLPTRTLNATIPPQNIYGRGGLPPGSLPSDPDAAGSALATALGSPGGGGGQGPRTESTQFGIGTSAPIGSLAAPSVGALPAPAVGVLPSGQVGIR